MTFRYSEGDTLPFAQGGAHTDRRAGPGASLGPIASRPPRYPETYSKGNPVRLVASEHFPGDRPLQVCRLDADHLPHGGAIKGRRGALIDVGCLVGAHGTRRGPLSQERGARYVESHCKQAIERNRT